MSKNWVLVLGGLALSVSSLLGSRAFAHDSFPTLAEVTDPCAASALEAAAQKAQFEASMVRTVYSFTSFGPLTINADEIKAGANQAYAVGFTSYDSRPALKLRVGVYCQQGGWKQVVSIARQ